MKFGTDDWGSGQLDDYSEIAGDADDVEELNPKECECSDDNRTQEQVALVTAAKTVNDAHISLGDRALAVGGTILGALGTAVAIASPFEGPAGEIALGALTAGMAARVFGSSALSAAARQALARGAAASWARIFQSGAQLAH
ncbi:hypothetical protein SAMN04487972_1167 [Paracoccus halophilus]|uniref:Uncharacterized protein n=1 Tax=Paracoccus halophilus TaxID=376733 RepID=A0A1I0TYU9_9RHOB|nr:hypothetical protein [Paracoccus halophilus]SFA56820.1 hypothetical protein SAMN04487972_1167 [Paracoccus halophilus]